MIAVPWMLSGVTDLLGQQLVLDTLWRARPAKQILSLRRASDGQWCSQCAPYIAFERSHLSKLTLALVPVTRLCL